MAKELLLRDLSGHAQLDQNEYPQTVDVTNSFVISSVRSSIDTSQPSADDLFVDENIPVNVCKNRTVRLFARAAISSSDITKLIPPTFKKYLLSEQANLPDPIDLVEKKTIEKPHSVDIREPKKLFTSPVRYPDIYHIPAPWWKKIGQKTLYALHRAGIFRKRHASGIMAAIAILCSLSLLGVAAKNILTTKTLHAYESLQSGIITATLDPVLAQAQLYRTQQDFSMLGAWFFPLRIALDNPIISVPSVRSAGKVIEAGKLLSQGAAQGMELYGQFLREQSRPSAHLQSESGSTLSPYLIFRWTDFLKANRSLVNSIADNINRADATLADLNSVGDAAKDAKLIKAKKLLREGAKLLSFATTNFDDLIYMA